MQELVLTPSTLVIVAAILAGVFLAVRRMVRNGLCDCGEKCDDSCCSGCKGCGSCDKAECPSSKLADRILDDLA